MNRLRETVAYARGMDDATFKAWRGDREWSQEKAARNLGVTLRTVQYWEAGEVPIPETVQRLMRAMAEHEKVFEPYVADRKQRAKK